MSDIHIVNIVGSDRVGLTADFFAVIKDLDIRILDIGQSVIHNQVSQALMLENRGTHSNLELFELLRTRAKSLQLDAKIKTISSEAYQQWVEKEREERYLLTMLTREISTEEIARVSQVTREHGLNIQDIFRLSGRVPIDRPITNATKSCVEFSVHGIPRDAEAMKASFLHIASELDIDIAIQKDDVYRRSRRLVCFDMDSTLIEAEVINLLAETAGVGEQVSRITEDAMNGLLDFDESFNKRLHLLKGLDESVLKQIALQLPIMQGAETLISYLKAFGFKTAILSGGFDYFGRHLQKRFGIDHVYANQLEIENGKLTGRAIAPIVNGKAKARLLEELAREEGIDIRQTIAVGDGANDLPMLAAAGLGIAFRAKPLVREAAKQSLSTHGLDSILYLLGFRDKELSAV